MCFGAECSELAADEDGTSAGKGEQSKAVIRITGRRTPGASGGSFSAATRTTPPPSGRGLSTIGTKPKESLTGIDLSSKCGSFGGVIGAPFGWKPSDLGDRSPSCTGQTASLGEDRSTCRCSTSAAGVINPVEGPRTTSRGSTEVDGCMLLSSASGASVSLVLVPELLDQLASGLSTRVGCNSKSASEEVSDKITIASSSSSSFSLSDASEALMMIACCSITGSSSSLAVCCSPLTANAGKRRETVDA